MTYESKGTVSGRVVRVMRDKLGEKQTEKITVVIDPTTAGAKYPNLVPVTAFGKAADHFAGVTEGAEIVCSVWLRGREWQGRYFSEIAVADCTIIEAGAAHPVDAGTAGMNETATPDAGAGDDDGMPF